MFSTSFAITFTQINNYSWSLSGCYNWRQLPRHMSPSTFARNVPILLGHFEWSALPTRQCEIVTVYQLPNATTNVFPVTLRLLRAATFVGSITLAVFINLQFVFSLCATIQSESNFDCQIEDCPKNCLQQYHYLRLASAPRLGKALNAFNEQCRRWLRPFLVNRAHDDASALYRRITSRRLFTLYGPSVEINFRLLTWGSYEHQTT